jgi:hypothetical protein
MLMIGAGIAALAVVFVGIAASCTECRDGWKSRSAGRGTCSWHGGIDD